MYTNTLLFKYQLKKVFLCNNNIKIWFNEDNSTCKPKLICFFQLLLLFLWPRGWVLVNGYRQKWRISLPGLTLNPFTVFSILIILFWLSGRNRRCHEGIWMSAYHTIEGMISAWLWSWALTLAKSDMKWVWNSPFYVKLQKMFGSLF